MDRRRFVSTLAALGAAGVAGASWAGVGRSPAHACIWINLVGGPSQLDTWDPKPEAPVEVRGPFASIQTAVPGVRLSELFPGLASRLDQVQLIRGLNHPHLPTHEAGWQELHTGDFQTGPDAKPRACLAAKASQRGQGGKQGWHVLPGLLQADGLCLLDAGQSGGTSDAVPKSGTWASSGSRPLLADVVADAARLVATGARFVTINTAPTVFHERTWDCHADGGSLAVTVEQTRQLGMELDGALCLLLDTLQATGLLQETLLVATGEMGRTPHLNARGGRDHWARAWTGLVAGAGLPGGAVLGRTDGLGGEPVEGGMRAAELHRMVGGMLGIPGKA